MMMKAKLKLLLRPGRFPVSFLTQSHSMSKALETWFDGKLCRENNMYSFEDIRAKSQLVRDSIDLVLAAKKMSVDRMFLIGSYASGRANEYSDIDYLVQLSGGTRQFTYPEF